MKIRKRVKAVLKIKSILIHKYQRESTRIKTSLTRVNTNQHESNTSPTRVNTNQHESKTGPR